MALDRIDDELRAELPAHMRAFARAHCEGRVPPAAPLAARLDSTLQTAIAACADEDLFDRGLALLRLVAPIAIEDDPMVAAARRQTPTWAGLAELSRARDAAAWARFGISAIEVFHTLHGTLDLIAERGIDRSPHSLIGSAVTLATLGSPRRGGNPCRGTQPGMAGVIDGDDPGPAVEGWQTPDSVCDATALQDVWTALAARLGLTGSVRIDRAERARPRTFVVEPRQEVIVVAAAIIETPADRFALLHELGHAAAALVLDPGVPRVLDEAVAAYVARFIEPPSWLPTRWLSDLAEAARQRRVAIAAMLDRIERALPELPHTPGPTPPWALWHDPGASASYVAAEVIADRLRKDLGPNPPRGQFARALAAERDQIDRRTRI